MGLSGKACVAIIFMCFASLAYCGVSEKIVNVLDFGAKANPKHDSTEVISLKFLWIFIFITYLLIFGFVLINFVQTFALVLIISCSRLHLNHPL